MVKGVAKLCYKGCISPTMWFKIQNQQVRLNIKVKPNAKKTAFIGFSEESLLISLHAKPHKGAANIELINYLAELFHLPKSKVILQRGEGSRHKQVIVPLTDSVQCFIVENSQDRTK
jgi:uncharacterized protein (TIGR00251 family)